MTHARSPIRKILIANRGEIAVRVIRTCRERGLPTVAVHSRADFDAPHVRMADESVFIGESASSASYLLMDRILDAAEVTGADAIHPGYGFLSENAEFAERCAARGVRFIGPPAEAIRVMGDKTAARELMEKAAVPCPPGTRSALRDEEEAVRISERIGYPVLIKAAAGGGGKGMRIVADPAGLRSAIRAARSEAANAFGDGRIYVEKYLEQPRHVEFQILADAHGNVVHLYERECSIQRRHQKVVEEAPCAILTDDLRRRMADAAVMAARACGYEGAGTVEFLVDRHREFHFLEMNTRLQVEHPITEWITGLDLVDLQISIAEGRPLPFTQADIPLLGHAIECRIYAEDPSENFMPGTGRLHRHRIPSGQGVRVDAGVEEGQEVSIHYDPMIAKLSTFGATRDQAIARMKRALGEYDISGPPTTIPFCSFVMDHPAFRRAEYDTHFVADHFRSVTPAATPSTHSPAAPLAIAAALLHGEATGATHSHSHSHSDSHLGPQADSRAEALPGAVVDTTDSATRWSRRRWRL